MTIKDATILFFASLILGWAIAETHPQIADPIDIGSVAIPTQQDTIIVPKDTICDVKDKTALFIGDSHTSNHSVGWQIILCKKTKLWFDVCESTCEHRQHHNRMNDLDFLAFQ